ncbi:nucleoside-diphosphate sugar epimerase [Candidatus Pacearchaeota archaeon]|nr:nucleoside-diphosphate sugar epimerase [Candidatus Pacearchaeota archaeon]
MAKILVTGGLGFIGSHLTDKLIERNNEVIILDNLSSTKEIPDYLNKKARLIKGDINNKELLDHLIKDIDFIFHKASSVGIAQSNYEVIDFVKNNSLGTSTLLQSIIDAKRKPKLILAASNTTYGEGLYSCSKHGSFHPQIRDEIDIFNHGLEIVCPNCQKPAIPVPTPESTELNSNSVYALTKKNQEELIMFLGRLYKFPIVILKYFNVFGPRQSLSNPYTGVAAIFTSRIKNNSPLIVYEDGNQTRDFIYIDDVINANLLAMDNPKANYKTFNVGSGKPIAIKHIAHELYGIFNKQPNIQITENFRKGDIRHCIADNTKINELLGWEPTVSFEEGLKKTVEWSQEQEARDDFEKADRELKEKGLM